MNGRELDLLSIPEKWDITFSARVIHIWKSENEFIKNQDPPLSLGCEVLEQGAGLASGFLCEQVAEQIANIS